VIAQTKKEAIVIESVGYGLLVLEVIVFCQFELEFFFQFIQL
jgi:hypothetical protein